MKTMKKVIKGGLLSLAMAFVIAAPTFAAKCSTSGTDLGGEYSGLALTAVSSTTAPTGFPVKCAGATLTDATGTYNIYGKDSASCAKAASLAANPDGCESRGLTETIQLIINMIIFAIGLVAVVMVILGGIQYSTSQGAADKVKKAKDTIMYGIIGLVVAILAFAIVNFVLSGVLG